MGIFVTGILDIGIPLLKLTSCCYCESLSYSTGIFDKVSQDQPLGGVPKFPARLLHRNQRLVLEALRVGAGGCKQAIPDFPHGSLLAEMGGRLAGDLSLLPPQSPRVAASECLILGAIAALQRMSGNQLMVKETVGDCLRACAGALGRGNMRLPFTLLLRSTLMEYGWIPQGLVQSSGAQSGRAPHRGRPSGLPREGTLQRKAVDYASRYETVSSSEFRNIGISRQYLSLMCNRGLLEHVSFGVYRLAHRHGALPAIDQVERSSAL